jgi:hypothetical protein
MKGGVFPYCGTEWDKNNSYVFNDEFYRIDILLELIF